MWSSRPRRYAAPPPFPTHPVYEERHHEAICAALRGGHSADEAKAIADALYADEIEKRRKQYQEDLVAYRAANP